VGTNTVHHNFNHRKHLAVNYNSTSFVALLVSKNTPLLFAHYFEAKVGRGSQWHLCCYKAKRHWSNLHRQW